MFCSSVYGGMIKYEIVRQVPRYHPVTTESLKQGPLPSESLLGFHRSPALAVGAIRTGQPTWPSTTVIRFIFFYGHDSRVANSSRRTILLEVAKLKWSLMVSQCPVAQYSCSQIDHRSLDQEDSEDRTEVASR